MLLLQYMSRVICHDGVKRQWLEHAIFNDLLTFRQLLARWNGTEAPNGGVYEYFETSELSIANMRARPISKSEEKSLPLGTICHDVSGYFDCDTVPADRCNLNLRADFRKILAAQEVPLTLV